MGKHVTSILLTWLVMALSSVIAGWFSGVDFRVAFWFAIGGMFGAVVKASFDE